MRLEGAKGERALMLLSFLRQLRTGLLFRRPPLTHSFSSRFALGCGEFAALLLQERRTTNGSGGARLILRRATTALRRSLQGFNRLAQFVTLVK
jgi:hypothetical protein